jgi:5-methyltetrahydropteroyltriglutamate--homocysteine methyltransferase
MCTRRKNERIEAVGSFLRPTVLKEARKAFEISEITAEQLTEIENEEIIKVVQKQVDVGLKIVTDGEFRQSYWHLDYFWGFDGVERIKLPRGYQFHGEETRNDSACLVSKISFTDNHPFLRYFSFLQSVSPQGVTVRQSIPAPAQCYAELLRETNADRAKEFYANLTDLQSDISRAYRDSILALYNLGCRDIKIDDCTWGMLCDTNFWKSMAGDGFDPKDLQEVYLKVNNEAIADLPSDLRISTHICRGNYHSTWATSGGYEPVGDTLFARENFDHYYLEFDDERSGNFEPLRFLPDHKSVVLGLITSKSGKLEDKATIIKRIKEAAQYVSLDRLSLSPQCGFASTEEGNVLTEEDQWRKIRFIKEIADEVWGND